jgi:hypothetical protein
MDFSSESVDFFLQSQIEVPQMFHLLVSETQATLQENFARCFAYSCRENGTVLSGKNQRFTKA